MEKKIAPSERKAQEIDALLQGQLGAENGEALLSMLVRLSTERVLQEALEQEQAAVLGRERYERRDGQRGYRNGYENGTVKTAEGVMRVEVPQIRGRDEPYTIGSVEPGSEDERRHQAADCGDVRRRTVTTRH